MGGGHIHHIPPPLARASLTGGGAGRLCLFSFGLDQVGFSTRFLCAVGPLPTCDFGPPRRESRQQGSWMAVEGTCSLTERNQGTLANKQADKRQLGTGLALMGLERGKRYLLV